MLYLKLLVRNSTFLYVVTFILFSLLYTPSRYSSFKIQDSGHLLQEALPKLLRVSEVPISSVLAVPYGYISLFYIPRLHFSSPNSSRYSHSVPPLFSKSPMTSLMLNLILFNHLTSQQHEHSWPLLPWNTFLPHMHTILSWLSSHLCGCNFSLFKILLWFLSSLLALNFLGEHIQSHIYLSRSDLSSDLQTCWLSCWFDIST